MTSVLRSALRSIWYVLVQSGRTGPLVPLPVRTRRSGRRGIDAT